ncbi:hypothetical protein PDESU_03775 [Pontiella desulfatans]|uniref:Uncharacterized protein n=1 Tax=Pontiella desulfatans TaxID=2750659 RepID=A0A6C2U5N3_PONDE|nr:hypothetical protein [Pontiella desulfatans]VGO15193.1 hypothetical protein PDESU_03775 [Pontiella desulfatans]
MAKKDYSSELCNELGKAAGDPQLLIKHRPVRYEKGTVLPIDITGVFPAISGKAELTVDKFLGGGFAGQVYRCKLTGLELPAGTFIPGLEKGNLYAVKIVIPPSGFSRWFRNTTYWLAFQGPFSSQVNHGACRAGLLWQKLVRRAGLVKFGRETAVKDAYASFWDSNLNAYGEITEWVEGRMWHLEADEDISRRFDWKNVPLEATGSPEYVDKRRFMRDMVELMHAMGAPEFARQYEWSTMKSQPNCMKRTDTADGGLCAIDFRAGLALLPWLPMSPGDFKLILNGLKRGALVQFDRCDLSKMEAYVADHPEVFTDVQPMIDELKVQDRAYRRSLWDITHHGLRPTFDKELRQDVINGLVEGYLADDLVDDDFAETLRKGGLTFSFFHLLGAVPLLGKMIRQRWGSRSFRKHMLGIFTKPAYFKAALKARAAHDLIGWHRAGRTDETRTRKLADNPGLFFLERFTVGFLPIGLHRLCIRPVIAWNGFVAFFKFIYDFAKDEAFREKWFLDQVAEGEADGMLTREEHDHIVSIIKEPYIVKYLKSMAVHFCTIPVTQIFSVITGAFVAAYVFHKTGDKSDASLAFAGIVALFQVTPISPGSLCRGFYVVYLMIRERNWRDYLVAAPLSFVKYIGYLAFPLQMTTTYPHLARFLVSRRATSVVHIIPVFGEHGALLEHWVFDLFFNIPQIMGRHMRGLLTLWMLLGIGIIAPALAQAETTKGIVGLSIALVAVFICPRLVFLPILSRGKKA